MFAAVTQVKAPTAILYFNHQAVHDLVILFLVLVKRPSLPFYLFTVEKLDNISLSKSCDETRPPPSRMYTLGSVGASLWPVVQQSAGRCC